jgi:hypothetical protein
MLSPMTGTEWLFDKVRTLSSCPKSSVLDDMMGVDHSMTEPWALIATDEFIVDRSTQALMNAQ